MNLKPQILRVLDLMGGRPQTPEAIINSIRLSQEVTEADVFRAIAQLESAGHVAGTRNELLDKTVWIITFRGKLALADL
jgi:hypothetical protein